MRNHDRASEFEANDSLDPSNQPRWMEPSARTLGRTNPKPGFWSVILRRLWLWF